MRFGRGFLTSRTIQIMAETVLRVIRATTDAKISRPPFRGACALRLWICRYFCGGQFGLIRPRVAKSKKKPRPVPFRAGDDLRNRRKELE